MVSRKVVNQARTSWVVLKFRILSLTHAGEETKGILQHIESVSERSSKKDAQDSPYVGVFPLTTNKPNP